MKKNIKKFNKWLILNHSKDIKKLGKLIIQDKIDESITLACFLVNKYFPFISTTNCINYGEYIYYLLKLSIKNYYLEKNMLFENYSKTKHSNMLIKK